MRKTNKAGTRAVVVAFHKYTPFGDEFYDPILKFFLKNYRAFWKDEIDQLYILDSTWNVEPSDDYEVIKVDPSLRYYDAYNLVLPQIKEDAVMFMDDDTVIYKKGIVKKVFDALSIRYMNAFADHMYDVVSIYDTIGDYKTDKMGGKNKFCPYFFAARTETLMKYRGVEWGPHMPHSETLGYLTEVMLSDGLKPFEFEEDKNSLYIDGSRDGETGKDLGYYHIRAGSTIAYLLATKYYGDYGTYLDYLKNQPKNEYMRHFAWYCTMNESIDTPFLADAGVKVTKFLKYLLEFQKYHKLS